MVKVISHQTYRVLAAEPLANQGESDRERASPNGITVTDDGGELRKLEDIEADLIRMAIDKYKGHMSEVARRLGIGRSTLYRKVRDLGLDVTR